MYNRLANLNALMRKRTNRTKYYYRGSLNPFEYIAQTTGICWVAVTNDPDNLKYVDEKTEDLCILALENKGSALKHIKHIEQTDRMCEVAVENDGLALKYVGKQTHIICIKAIKQNKYAMLYINRNINTYIKSSNYERFYNILIDYCSKLIENNSKLILNLIIKKLFCNIKSVLFEYIRTINDVTFSNCLKTYPNADNKYAKNENNVLFSDELYVEIALFLTSEIGSAKTNDSILNTLIISIENSYLQNKICKYFIKYIAQIMDNYIANDIVHLILLYTTC